MVEFGTQREEWLREFLGLPNGIPSHDTFNRVLQLIDPNALSTCLGQDGEFLLGHLDQKQLCFDGKKLKGTSPHSKGNQGLYILNAWVAENRVCIGEKKVGKKSNEIKAIPELLGELDITGSIVSIDAIGCQREIAEQIMDQEADYLLAVKKNQKELFEQIQDSFLLNAAQIWDEQWEYDHGRYEKRTCEILPAQQMLLPELSDQWKGIRMLVKIEAYRETKGKKSTEIRYYISSSSSDNPRYYNHLVRGHWGIENQLHWHLDISFSEDASRARKGFAPQNLAILRKMALHRIAQMKDKLSMKKRRFRASLNNDYLLKVLQFWMRLP